VGLVVYFDEGWDPKTRRDVEDAIRKCIGDPPKDEKWFASLTTGFAQNYCEVQVTTPNQTRTRLFFEEASMLPKAITDWINIYPLR
jgi:hypothetical protein